MTKKEARERLLELLEEQQKLGLLANVPAFVEILRLSRIADLNPVAPPVAPSSSRPAPTTFPVHRAVPYTKEGIAEAEVALERIEREQKGAWLDRSKFLRDEIALARRMCS